MPTGGLRQGSPTPCWDVSRALMVDNAAHLFLLLWSTLNFIVLVCVEIVWLCCDYGDFRIYAYGTEEAYRNFGKEFLLLSSSHRGDLDWVAGFVLGARYRFLHVRVHVHACGMDVDMSALIPPQSIRSLPKQSVRYVPGFGQLLWMLEYPFLARNNYQKDKETIAKIAQAYKTYPFPIQASLHAYQARWSV